MTAAAHATPVQTLAQDRTKGPVGLSGTVLESKVLHPRASGDLVALTITIICGQIRCHITKMFDKPQAARDGQALVPPGSHLTAFGQASDLSLHRGELHLTTSRVITYHLMSDVKAPDLFAHLE